jgi:hypothetical protein
MLINTIKSHSILSILVNEGNLEELQENDDLVLLLFGLHRNSLRQCPNTNLYYIDEKALQFIFYELCKKNDLNKLKILVTSDYDQFHHMDAQSTFYLKQHPFADLDIILRGMNWARFAGAKNAWLFLRDTYQDQINLALNEDDIFNEKKSDVLFELALVTPNDVFEQFQKYDNDFKLTKEIFNKHTYDTILNTLATLACASAYFKFSANLLLIFAVGEGKLGVYHGNYIAFHRFKELFYSTCADTEVSLKARKNYLEAAINDAETKWDYYKLLMLVRTLGIAANIFESGEAEHIEDDYLESYIHFALEKLVHFAGRNDESGLDLTAEEELHCLLKYSIDEASIHGISDVPFKIFRLYCESGRRWNQNPFYHINDLHEHIEDWKKDKKYPIEADSKMQIISELEFRLEQLISLFSTREFISEDFNLFLGAKKEDKICEIDLNVDEKTQLELHARQSLAERLIFVGKTNLHDIERGWPRATYLIANFGMVISDSPQKKEGNHKRIYKTIPIEILDRTITGRKFQHGGHAEEALYEYLLKDEIIKLLLLNFKEQYRINTNDHKVYAVIFDLHGTYDMCLFCSAKGLEFQNKFRELLLLALSSQYLKTLTKYPNQLPIIIRYSSDLNYHYPNSTDNKKKGILTIIKAEGNKRDLQRMQLGADSRYTLKRDIKYYGANLVIHGKENWHLFWNISKRDEYKDRQVNLERWTAFTTDYEYANLDEGQKSKDYTKGGKVETNRSSDQDSLNIFGLNL